MIANVLSILLFSGLAQMSPLVRREQTCSDNTVYSTDEGYCASEEVTCCYNETPGYADHRGPQCPLGFVTSGYPDYILVSPPLPVDGSDCWCFMKGPGGFDNC